MRALSSIPAALLLLTLAACGDPGGEDPGLAGAGGAGGGGGTGGEEEKGPEIAWLNCPWGPGSCASIEVPLDWDAPEEERTLPFFVRRIPAKGGASKGQLWLLQGGPGSAGWDLVHVASSFQDLAPGYDILVPDYRGTGHSSWLGCDEGGDDIDIRCMRDLRGVWGDGLEHFSTTGAAHDIRYVAEALREEGDRLLFYGVSYGTFVLNRLLTLYPELADAALLDSVCPASGCDVRMDANAVRVVQHGFSLCGQDAFCAERLGEDPWGRAMALFDAMAEGHCDAFLGYPENVRMLGDLMSYGGLHAETLPLALAAIYRAERCTADDVVALESLGQNLWGHHPGFDPFDAPASSSSPYLSLHVIFSEFWPEDLGVDQAIAEVDALPFELGTLRYWASMRSYWTWPIVPTPAEEKVWASTETPILMLNGDFDAQTHLDGLAGVEAHFRHDAQQLVEVPMAGHGVLFSSHQVSRDFTCGMQIARDFFADPATPVDAGCADGAPGVNFRGSSWLARNLMGTDDLWDAAGATGQALLPPPTLVEERAVETLRRHLREGISF